MVVPYERKAAVERVDCSDSYLPDQDNKTGIFELRRACEGYSMAVGRTTISLMSTVSG